MSRLTLTAPNHEKPQNKKGSYFRNYLIQRAENGTQTRDPQLGRLVLYRLSYFRMMHIPHALDGLATLADPGGLSLLDGFTLFSDPRGEAQFKICGQ